MSDQQETSAQLASALNRGDKAALARFYSRHYAGLQYFLQRRSGDAELARDIAQESFCVLLERLDREPLTDPDRVLAFLHNIALNLYIGERRRQERRNTFTCQEVVARLVSRAPGPPQDLARERSGHAVRRLLDALHNERDRRLLFDYFILEKDKTEICAEQALSQRHFDRVLFRAKQRFRALLQPRG